MTRQESDVLQTIPVGLSVIFTARPDPFKVITYHNFDGKWLPIHTLTSKAGRHRKVIISNRKVYCIKMLISNKLWQYNTSLVPPF